MFNKLSQFLNHHNLDTTALSKLLDVPYPTAWRIVNRRVIPSDKLKLKIYAITNGYVTPNDFYDLPPLESQQGQMDFFHAHSSPELFTESATPTPMTVPRQEGGVCPA